MSLVCIGGSPRKKETRGRKAHAPTEESRRQVVIAVAAGLPRLLIARLVGVAEMTLEKHYKLELETGLANVVSGFTETLISKGKNGDLGAICFFLKTQGRRFGWVERQELTGANGGAVAVTHKVEYVIVDAPRPGPAGVPPSS